MYQDVHILYNYKFQICVYMILTLACLALGGEWDVKNCQTMCFNNYMNCLSSCDESTVCRRFCVDSLEGCTDHCDAFQDKTFDPDMY